jgi:hypothetical protein
MMQEPCRNDFLHEIMSDALSDASSSRPQRRTLQQIDPLASYQHITALITGASSMLSDASSLTNKNELVCSNPSKALLDGGVTGSRKERA